MTFINISQEMRGQGAGELVLMQDRCDKPSTSL